MCKYLLVGWINLEIQSIFQVYYSHHINDKRWIRLILLDFVHDLVYLKNFFADDNDY